MRPIAGDEAVARRALLLHAEIRAAVGDELVELLEGAFIEQQRDALARRQLAGLVFALAALGASAFFGRGAASAQFFHLHLSDLFSGAFAFVAMVDASWAGCTSSLKIRAARCVDT